MSPAVPDSDSVSMSDSQTTTSSTGLRRYPMRSCRKNSVAGSTTEREEDEEPPQMKHSARKKTKRGVARRRHSSVRAGQLARLTEQALMSRSRTKSPPVVSCSNVFQARMNPLFLRMSHWIQENSDEVCARRARSGYCLIVYRVLGAPPQGSQVSIISCVRTS